MPAGSARPGVAAGVGVILFALAFLAPALWIFQEQQRILRTWPEVTATGARTAVVPFRQSNRTLYRAEYELKYTVAGREFVTPASSSVSHGSEEAARAETERYGPDTQHRVRYNLENPHDLRLNANSPVRFFLLPLVFGGVGLLLVLAGAAIIYFAWRAGPGLREERATHSREYNRRGNRIGGYTFGAIGLTMVIIAAWLALRERTILTSWPETQAVVVRSELKRGHNFDGTLWFRPEAEFRYSVTGREYTSRSEGRRANNFAWAQRQVDVLAPGSRHAIRHHPADPAKVRFDAGLNLGSFAITAAVGLLGLVFLPLGLVLLRAGTRVTHVPCESCGVMRETAWKFCAECGVPAAAGTVID